MLLLSANITVYHIMDAQLAAGREHAEPERHPRGHARHSCGGRQHAERQTSTDIHFHVALVSQLCIAFGSTACPWQTAARWASAAHTKTALIKAAAAMSPISSLLSSTKCGNGTHEEMPGTIVVNMQDIE